jgi:hypothetical protein
MKNLFILIALFIGTKTFCQNFEGTIRFSMKMESADPKKKAQMDAQLKNDSAALAKMKEVEERMKDPQYKAIMEKSAHANAQGQVAKEAAGEAVDALEIKTQIDNYRAGTHITNMSSMMPSGMIVRIKDQNVLSKMEGGMNTTETLYLKDKDQSYSIDREKKTYYITGVAGKPTSPPKVKVTKTSETATVLGYNCVKYIVETERNGKKVTQNVWASSEVKDFDFKALAKQRVSGDQSLFYEGIDGMPLRTEVKVRDFIMSMEVAEIRKESLPSSDFSIPADFKEVPSPFKK